MASFSYTIKDRLGFYAAYFWYKFILPLEVKSPRFAMWKYELLYTLHKFRDYTYCMPWKGKQDLVRTRFGIFRIRSNTADLANVSPAFERRDLNYLFQQISSLLKVGKKVLFLDVGGDIGTYSIAIGNRFRNDPLKIICFEPIPASCELIRENIRLNDLEEKVELMEVALMDKACEDLKISLNTLAPGSSSIKGEGEEVIVRGVRLDEVLSSHSEEFDAVVIKLDVEGAEEFVLRGASGLLVRGREWHLMVEDFIDTSIIRFLESTGWRFVCKRTDYNSWWKRS